MRKSIFAKYMITFSLIIIVSFSVLTFIFSSIIKNYSTRQIDNSLIESVNYLSDTISSERYSTADKIDISMISATALREIDDICVFVFDSNGKLVWSNYLDAVRSMDFSNDKKSIDLLKLVSHKKVNDKTYLYYSGYLTGLFPEKCHVFGLETDNPQYPYVFACSVTASEDITVPIKTSVFTASLWVILASVIAVNFITERMLRPIRQIKKATTDYAKGNFKTRVNIEGKDEIALLGQAFNDMADSLEKTEKMRNAFLANISHDLRTPMTTISGFIDGINSGAISPEKQPYYLDLISAEIHRLSRLVSSILDVSRLESGERKFVYTDFDVAEVARLILISFEQKIEEKKLDVSFDSPDSVFVHADKDAIYQVLYNLCHNAIKFAYENGKFIIRIEEKDEKVFVSVFDEGQSIAAEEMPFVFDRFYKTDKSRGLDKSGVGLGLYICKSIMDAHKENISVKSTEGKDCEFTFTLTRGSESPKKLASKGV